MVNISVTVYGDQVFWIILVGWSERHASINWEAISVWVQASCPSPLLLVPYPIFIPPMIQG